MVFLKTKFNFFEATLMFSFDFLIPEIFITIFNLFPENPTN